jgi:hypothetical protein
MLTFLRKNWLAAIALVVGLVAGAIGWAGLSSPTAQDTLVCIDGAPGPDGQCGPIGPEGPEGPNGPEGPCGPEGTIGPDGECGPIGPPGTEGPCGPEGAIGPDGECGPIGPEGPCGPEGPPGADGECGAVGPIGPAGPQGIQGIQGIQGLTGEVGPKGDKGDRGEPGITTMGAYGSFYSVPGQQVSGASGSPMLAPLSFVASGVSMSSDGSISVATAGVYNIQFSAQFWRVAKRTDVVDVWLMRKPAGSGVFQNIDNTNTEITLSERMELTERAVYGWNFMIPISPGDEIRVMWYSNDRTSTTSVINGDPASTNPDRPAVPPVLLTVHQVG